MPDKKRTKSIFSLRGDCITTDMARQLTQTSFDALRLVYNYEGPERITEFVKVLRFSRGSDSSALPIMLDLSDKARAKVGSLENPVELAFGDKVKFGKGPQKGWIPLQCDQLDAVFNKDSMIYVANGEVVLKVVSVSPSEIDAEVVQGGRIYSAAEVHVPDTETQLTFDDINGDELKEFVKLGIDYLVIPGMVLPKDVERLKDLLTSETQSPPWVLLKVHSEKVISNLDILLEHVQGIFISRVGLALNFGPASVPIITKEIIQSCNAKAKIVVTASDMLGSMRRNATPTRAEVSDVANAVHDGTDAVVLSDEVAFGTHFRRAWELMNRIIVDAEAQAYSGQLNWLKSFPAIENEMDAVAFAAYRTANRTNAKAIVCITVGGNTALKLASFRPPLPIIAVTFSKEVLRRLTLVRGVDGIPLDIAPNIDQVLPLVNDRLLRDSWLKAGDRIIFVSITLSSVGREASNLFTIQTLQ